MNKEQYKAHFRQRLTEEDLRDNPPDLETASGRIASGKPASYRQLPFLPLEDEDIDQAEDQDEIDSENNGTYGSPEHELRQEKREAQKEKNEKTREIADEVLMVMSGSRAGLGGDDDWDAARVNPDNYDPDDPFYNSQPPIYEKGSSTTRDIAAGISDLEMGIPGSAAKLAKRIEHWNIPKKPINDTSELIAAQAEKDIPGTHDQTYKDMEDVRIDAEKKSIKEQYKTYLRQRLYEEHSDNHDIYHDIYDMNHVSTPAQLALQQKSHAAAWARLDVVNNGFDVDPRNSKKMDDHPHGALTRAISRHTGLHPLEVFEFTRNLTASSPQKDIDREIQHFVGLQLSRQTTGREPYFGDEDIRNEVTPKFSDLSKQPGSPYFVPSAPGGIYDLAVAQHAAYAAEKGPRERFIRDFSKHINDNVSTGVHTEFTGAPRANGT